ncbi:MAG TPA: hypothetical protein VMW72_23195 [Sedimentisphaerales bacterium]|nr:hypothetical protein [Sedimentisphaerales bacterium]
MDLPDFQNARKWWDAFNKWPLSYRILVAIIIVIVLILVSLPFLQDFFSIDKSKASERPMFIVMNPNIRVGSNTLIVAENSAANLNRLLKVEYDGIVFPTGGTPISGSDPQMWHFTLYDKELPEHMLKEGTHELRFSFFDGEFSNISKIIISKKATTPFIELPEIDVSSFENIEIQTIHVHTARDLIRAIKTMSHP